jgi:hypothetical protein
MVCVMVRSIVLEVVPAAALEVCPPIRLRAIVIAGSGHRPARTGTRYLRATVAGKGLTAYRPPLSGKSGSSADRAGTRAAHK